MATRDSTPTARTASPREFIARWYHETLISETDLQAAVLPLVLPCRGWHEKECGGKQECCAATVLSARFGRLPTCKYRDVMTEAHWPDPSQAMLGDVLLTAPAWALLLEKLVERVAPPAWFAAWCEEWHKRFGEAARTDTSSPAEAPAPTAAPQGKPPAPHAGLNAIVDDLLPACGYDPNRYQPGKRQGFTTEALARAEQQFGQSFDRDAMHSRIIRRERRPGPVAARAAAAGALADETTALAAETAALADEPAAAPADDNQDDFQDATNLGRPRATSGRTILPSH